MGKFTFIETGIKDLYVIEPTVFGDNRGYFMETYNDEFKPYIKHSGRHSRRICAG